MPTNDLREYKLESETQNAPEPSAGEAPAASGVTLEEAREAYVQKNYILYEESFKAFDEAGGFRFTFCWPVFFAGILWFLYRKMYIESLTIFLLGLVAGGVSGVLGPPGGSGGLAFSLCMSVVLGLSARWFYWKAVDRKVEQAWDIHNGDSRAALAWLKSRGGVNIWLVAAVLGGMVLFLLSIGQQL